MDCATIIFIYICIASCSKRPATNPVTSVQELQYSYVAMLSEFIFLYAGGLEVEELLAIARGVGSCS